ncbi:hypothetical protein F7725_017772, partial [Dissostichus mawsoni]
MEQKGLTVGGSQLDHVRHFFTVVQREREREHLLPASLHIRAGGERERRSGREASRREAGASRHLSGRGAYVCGCREAGRLREDQSRRTNQRALSAEERRRKTNQRVLSAEDQRRRTNQRVLSAEERRTNQRVLSAEERRTNERVLSAEERRTNQRALSAEERRTNQRALSAEERRTNQRALAAEERRTNQRALSAEERRRTNHRALSAEERRRTNQRALSAEERMTNQRALSAEERRTNQRALSAKERRRTNQKALSAEDQRRRTNQRALCMRERQKTKYRRQKRDRRETEDRRQKRDRRETEERQKTEDRRQRTDMDQLLLLLLLSSDKLFQPNISVSSSMYGVSGAQQQGFQVFRGSTFTISCSIQPQYPGGSFQLNFTSINSANTYYSEPAVNHSAHFLFPAAEPAHQGSYSCVYHSRLLSVTVTGVRSDPEPFIIRAVVLPLTQLLVTIGLYFYCKATRGRRPSRQEDIELDYDDL